MATFKLSIAVLLFVAAISQAQAQVSQPLPDMRYALQGLTLKSTPPGNWEMLTDTTLSAYAYQIGTGVGNTLPAGLMVASDNAFYEIARMQGALITLYAKETWGGYGAEIVNQIVRKGTFIVDSAIVQLAHPLAYRILFVDEDGMFTIQVALGWNRKIGGTLEEAVMRSLKQAAKEVLAEKSRALLEEVDEL